jgi:hypothetical protein
VVGTVDGLLGGVVGVGNLQRKYHSKSPPSNRPLAVGACDSALSRCSPQLSSHSLGLRRYGPSMEFWQAALWGLAGGGAASLLSFMTAVVSSGYSWPWRKKNRRGGGELGPRLFVMATGAVLGAAVAAAAHDQIIGAWPAFAFGVGAPAALRGLLSGVEVAPRAAPAPITKPASSQSLPASDPGEIREDAS